MNEYEKISGIWNKWKRFDIERIVDESGDITISIVASTGKVDLFVKEVEGYRSFNESDMQNVVGGLTCGVYRGRNTELVRWYLQNNIFEDVSEELCSYLVLSSNEVFEYLGYSVPKPV